MVSLAVLDKEGRVNQRDILLAQRQRLKRFERVKIDVSNRMTQHHLSLSSIFLDYWALAITLGHIL